MRTFDIADIRSHPELKAQAAAWFHSKWEVPEEEYLASMDECISGGASVPQWYVALEDGVITGGVGVIENDFHVRRDLSPNVCALYVEPRRRGLGLAGALRALAAFIQADNHVDAAVVQVQRMGMALAAVANDGDGLSFEDIDVAVCIVVNLGHCNFLLALRRFFGTPGFPGLRFYEKDAPFRSCWGESWNRRGGRVLSGFYFFWEGAVTPEPFSSAMVPARQISLMPKGCSSARHVSV